MRDTFIIAAAAAFLLLGMPADAQLSKEETYQQLLDLAEQYHALKPQGDSAAEMAILEARYRELSETLGGDDPGGILSGGAAQRDIVLKGSPAAPPDPPGGPGPCTATTANFTDSPGSTITDGAPVAATLAVATADTFLLDVDLTTDITHTFASDLDITLTSPAGTTITITTDNGGGSDDVFSGTLWDDDGGDSNPPGPASDNTYANLVTETPLVPEEAMAAFIGEDPNGMWTLTITDDAGGDDGTLNSWDLDITTLDASPVNTGPTNFTDSPGSAITDGAPVGATLAVAALDAYLLDVNLTTDITHTFASDLDITLTSPGGTTITVTTDNGGGNDDVFSGTLWDDDGGDSNPPGPVTDNTFANLVTETPLVPEEALGAFIGEDPNGMWTLTITDDAGGDDGTLNSWDLDIITATCEIPVELMRFQIE